jgi:hypothetical protein
LQFFIHKNAFLHEWTWFSEIQSPLHHLHYYHVIKGAVQYLKTIRDQAILVKGILKFDLLPLQLNECLNLVHGRWWLLLFISVLILFLILIFAECQISVLVFSVGPTADLAWLIPLSDRCLSLKIVTLGRFGSRLVLVMTANIFGSRGSLVARDPENLFADLCGRFYRLWVSQRLHKAATFVEGFHEALRVDIDLIVISLRGLISPVARTTPGKNSTMVELVLISFLEVFVPPQVLFFHIK